MPDWDLSGDDLKYVSYSVLFTREDFEATLQKQQQEIVDYDTSGGSFGGLKVARCLRAISQGEIAPPEEWKQFDDGDKPIALPKTIGRHNKNGNGKGWDFNHDQLRYIRFVYEVEHRLPRGEEEYDKEEVEALRKIARNWKPPEPPDSGGSGDSTEPSEEEVLKNLNKVEFRLSTAAENSSYPWAGQIDEQRTATIDIDNAADELKYDARVLDAQDNEISRWKSISLKKGREYTLTLGIGKTFDEAYIIETKGSGTGYTKRARIHVTISDD